MTFGEDYLAVPDLFPGRLSGERWGENERWLDLAGGPYRLRGLSATQANGLATRYGELCAGQGAGAPIEVRVFRVSPRDFLTPEPRPWREYSLDLEAGTETIRVAAPQFMGRIELSERPRAGLWTSVEGPQPELVGVFENFLRILVAYRLNQQGGVLLHSAGVTDGKQAFLFIGPSGAGKSTISRISLDHGKSVLSDDMNAVCLDGEDLVVEKLPFAGDLGQTSCRHPRYPVAGIYRLEQALDHSLEDLSQPQAMALLVSCAPYLNGDAHRTDRLLHNLETLAEQAPVKTLAFRRDAGFWALLGES